MALKETRVTEKGIIEYDKVAVAIETLRAYEPIAKQKKDADGKSGYYVCISGGKDSSVIQQLCIMAGVDCQFYHNHTRLDHPETVYFVRREKKRLEELGYEFNITYPKETLESLVKRKKMLPTRLVRYCCQELKEGGRKRPRYCYGSATSREQQPQRRGISSYKRQEKGRPHYFAK